MHCSGCGKDIPFGGHVCPFCQRDKSSDQATHVGGVIGMLIGGTIGGWIGGFWGTIIGAIVVGALIVFVGAASGNHTAKKPPRVRVDRAPGALPAREAAIPPAKVTDDDPTSRLARLDALKAKGIITAEEHQDRRAAIIATL